MVMNDKIQWTAEDMKALEKLKQLLTSSPCSGLLDHFRLFHLFVCEKYGFMSSVLTQNHVGKQGPVAYYSKRLGSVAQTAHPTPARLLHYQNMHLTMSHVTLKQSVT